MERRFAFSKSDGSVAGEMILKLPSSCGMFAYGGVLEKRRREGGFLAERSRQLVYVLSAGE
jgi:hypothetical protein